MADLSFMGVVDYNAIPERGQYTPIEAGTYPAMITGSDIKDTKSGEGKYIELEITLIGGNAAGRKLITRLNVQNPNPKAVERAYGELKEICAAIGYNSLPKATEELHNKPFDIDVVVVDSKPYNDKNTGELKPGNPQNEIKKYKKAGGVAQQTLAAGAPTPAATSGFAWNQPKA